MTRQQRILVYRTSQGWRWRWYAGNGKIIAASTQAYSRRRDCIGNLSAVAGGIFRFSYELASGFGQGLLYRVSPYDASEEMIFVEVLR